MLDSYIKELKSEEGQPGKPMLARVLIDVYESATALDQMIGDAKNTGSLKVSAARRVLTQLQSDLEEATAKLKILRTGEETREQVPTGINKLLSQLLRVTVEIANASIHASKGERITLRELVQSYHDSFPYDELKQALEAHLANVKEARLKQRMNDDHAHDGDTFRNFKPKSTDPKEANREYEEHLREQALIRGQQARRTNLGKEVGGYARYMSRLPMSLKGLPYKAFRMPIVPDFKDMGLQIDPAQKLRSLGFKVTVLSDAFVVLEEQFLIAFDHKQMGIDSGVRKSKEGNFVVVRKTRPKEEIAENASTDKLVDLIDRINEKSHEKYALASRTFIPNPRNPRMWLAWVVRENQRKGIAQLASTVEAGWGLPLHGLDQMTVEDE